MTPTGRDTSGQLFGQSVDRAYLAYDYPGATRRFLHHHRPALGVLMETELWPNLIAQAAKEQVPLILVNARLSERSMKRAQRFHVLANAALRSLSALLAQSAADAERFKTLGANVTAITGSLKFDVTVPPEQQVLGAQFRARIGARPVLLWASTREGEEELLLDAYSQYALPEGTLVILVPRHPQRFGEVAGLVESRGLRMQRRSQEEPILASTQIWLGDSMGEMFAYYCAADLAYIGGGLLPYGTHNLIEASAVGCPVVLGPHTYNFEDAAVSAIAAGAARRVQDAKGLFAAAQEILTDTKTRATMAKGALEFALAHRGATRTTLLTLERYLGD
jgi:3-deoxy-D-manno-octulosonic-acid transferase